MKRPSQQQRTTALRGVSEMRPNYDFSNGERGKYAALYALGTNVVLLDADVNEVFKDSAAVNEALRTLIRVAGKVRAPKGKRARK